VEFRLISVLPLWMVRERVPEGASTARPWLSESELGLSDRDRLSLSRLSESLRRERKVEGWTESIEKPKGDTVLAKSCAMGETVSDSPSPEEAASSAILLLRVLGTRQQFMVELDVAVQMN